MRFIKNWFRKFYENRISIRHGYMQFLGNVAYIQISHEEYITLNPSSKRTGDIKVTTSGSRPVLNYKFWPPNVVYSESLPEVTLILEEDRISVEEPHGSWTIVDRKDPRVAALDDLFLSFAFYQPMRVEHKKKKETDAKTDEKILVEPDKNDIPKT